MTSSTTPQLPSTSTATVVRGGLRRGWYAVVVGVILGLVGALVVTAALPKRYTASTRVLVSSTGVNTVTQNANGRTNDSINLDTEAQLVTSAAVVQAASQTYAPFSRGSFQDVVNDISVTVPANTTVLQIAYTTDTAAGAQAGANALANAYLVDRQTTAQGSLDGQISNAKDNVTTLTDRLQTLSNAVSAAKGARRSFLVSQVGIVKSQITSVNQQLVTLNNVQVTPGRVVTAATRPTGPSSPSKVINVASGIGIGLLLGLTAAWLLVRFRRNVMTEDDLTRAAGAPCIAVLPPQEQTGAGSARSAAQYRRIALVAASTVNEPALLVVSAPLLSTSGSLLATGVATSLAHSGTTAALLQVHDLDVGRPRGVSTTRVRQADDLVSDSGESMPEALERIRGRHSMMVVDVPGATLDADAQTIAAHADAVLLVVDAGTPTRLVREAIEEFDTVGAPILGTVLIGRAKSARDRPAEDLAALYGSSDYRDRVPSRSTPRLPAKRTSDDPTRATAFRSRIR